MERLKNLLVPMCSLILLAVLGSSRKSVLARTDSIDSSAVDGYVSARMHSARIPGVALAIVRGDEIVYLKGYGRADPSGRPVTPQTPFLIGSITKPFTALAVMQLVEAGKVELDAPVQRYIHWFRVADPQASARITVCQLLTMTSGLPQVYETQLWTDQDDGALERTVRLLETKELSRPVGDSFGYSNANYETLGLIVQEVSGQSYEEYVKQHIFAPLDMRNSFVSQHEALRHGMASGHRWWFGIPIPVSVPYRRAELPAGYIISSAEDMAHFLVAQLNAGRYGDTSILSPDGMAFTHSEPPPKSYGVGWESTRVNGRRLISHDGGTSNFQASLFFDPEARVGVFIAANVVSALDTFSSPSGASPLDGPTVRAMAQSVLSIATNQPLPSPGPGHERLTLIFNLVILALTGVLVMSLARIPGRYRRLARRGTASRSTLRWHIVRIALLHFALPIAILYLALGVPIWKVIAEFQPDLAYWLYAAAIVLFLAGLVETALLRKVFRRTPEPQLLQPG